MSASAKDLQRSFGLARFFTGKGSKNRENSQGDHELQEMKPLALKLFPAAVVAGGLPIQGLPGDRGEVFQLLTSRAVEQSSSVAQLTRPLVPADKFEIYLKLLLLGDPASKRLLTPRFPETGKTSYMATLGVEFKTQKIEDDDKIILLQLWNISSSTRFHNFDYVYRGAVGGMVVYDVSNRDSYTSATIYINKMKENGIVNIILVGTNCECVNRVVHREEAARLAIEQNIPFTECVAGDVKSVSEAFDSLVMRGVENVLQQIV